MRDWVDDAVIADLEHTVLVHACPCTAARLDNVLLGGVSDGVGVRLVLGHGDTVLVVDGILVPVQRGVNTQREHVLVEGSHHARSHVRAPRHCLTVLIVEGNGGEDTSCPNLELDVGGLVEDECEDVFVVGHGADHLNHELAVSHDRCCAGAVVGVLVLETVVLLVHANDILELDGLTLGVGSVTVEILDVAQAVAAKGELVCSDAETDVAYVEGLLAVVRGSGI